MNVNRSGESLSLASMLLKSHCSVRIMCVRQKKNCVPKKVLVIKRTERMASCKENALFQCWRWIISLRKGDNWEGRDYKNKIWMKLLTCNKRQAHEGLNALIGRARKMEECSARNSRSFANELNVLHSRFDYARLKICCCIVCHIPCYYPHILLKEGETADSLSKMKPEKATSPARLKACVLKDYAPQLKSSLCKVVQVLVKRMHSAWIMETLDL